MLMMRPENNSDAPIRMDLCRQSTDTAWENTETKRGREISLSDQCRMCLESGFLIDGSGKCLMLVRKLRNIITSSSRRIPEDIWSCIIMENYHSEIICGTERQSQIQIQYMGQDGHYEFHTFLSVEPILADFGELSEKSYIPEWIIVGAETGSRKDKVIPRREWIENIVEQCRKYNIPVFMKPSLTDIWGEELIQEFPKALIHA